MLSKKFFIQNRERFRKMSVSGLIIITAHGMVQRSGDVVFPFRQDSNFFYLTGLADLADAVLVMCGNEEFLILPKRSEVEDIFGGEIDCDDIAKVSGISQILPYKAGWEQVKKLQQRRKTIYTLGSSPAKISALDSYYTNPARRNLISKIKRLFSDTEIKDIRIELMKMRQVKQPLEIEAIKKAIDITKSGFERTGKLIDQGVYEYQLEAEFDYAFSKNNTTHGYGPPIIAAGKNAVALHYRGGNGRVSRGEFVLMDVGAEFAGYSADITRMRYVGEISKRQAEILNAVKEVQDYAVNLLKDGIDWRTYVLETESFMGEELIKLGLIKRTDRVQIRKYFPHGISHSLGLDVHDVCDYKTIKENMVITVEPGIYIPEEGIGVRIEDDILITKNGTINLSESIAY